MLAYLKNLFAGLEGPTKQLDGKEITVRGLVKANRDNKSVGFLWVSDSSCFDAIQAVYDPEAFPAVAKLRLGESVIVTGTLVLTPTMKQPFEIHLTKAEITGTVDDDYPLQKKKTSYEFLRTLPHLRERTNTFNAVFRVRSELSFAIHEYFHDHGFFYIHTPILTGNDAEGAGQTFEVVADPKDPDEYFGKVATLTVSGQLHVEPFALTYQKVYTFGPTFRAEKSNTQRHAAEFWMIEPEIAYADIADDMDLMEDFLKTVVGNVVKRCPQDFGFFCKWVFQDVPSRLSHLLDNPFPTVDYAEGIEILKAAVKSGHKFQNPDIYWGLDLMSEHERYLTEEHFKGPIFLKNYPKDIKAFYMKQNPDGKTVAAVDLLFPDVGELCGGSQREEDLAKLKTRMEELKMNIPNYQWYLDTRRFGGCAHSGFGLGFDRLLMYITGLDNIRDVEPYPRTYGEMVF